MGQVTTGRFRIAVVRTTLKRGPLNCSLFFFMVKALIINLALLFLKSFKTFSSFPPPTPRSASMPVTKAESGKNLFLHTEKLQQQFACVFPTHCPRFAFGSSHPLPVGFCVSLTCSLPLMQQTCTL